MIQVGLYRVSEHDGETYGVLMLNGRPRFVTLEEAWKDNKPNISCIPVGNYLCSAYQSARFGSTYIVDNVPGRSGILFHPGNTALDTQGCILVGSSYNAQLGLSGINNSRPAFLNFLRLLKDQNEFELIIEKGY